MKAILLNKRAVDRWDNNQKMTTAEKQTADAGVGVESQEEFRREGRGRKREGEKELTLPANAQRRGGV